MKAALARIRDYFWTQGARDNVVGGLILTGLLAVLGAFWLWSKSGSSGNSTAALMGARAAMLSLWSWLVASVEVPRGVVWTTLLVGAGVCVYAALPLIRRLIGDVMPQYGVVVGAIELQKLRESARKEAVGASPTVHRRFEIMDSNDPVPSFTLGLMRLLARAYPKSVDMSAIAARLCVTYLAAEKRIEDIEASELLTILRVGSTKSVVLTTEGRDYCYQHGLDSA